MDPRRIASVAAVVGGVGWLGKVALAGASGGTGGGLVSVLYLLGLAGVLVAVAGGGYTLVERAPVWLRALVVAATVALAVVLGLMADAAIKAVYGGEGWLRDELDLLLVAVVALALGVRGLTRRRDGRRRDGRQGDRRQGDGGQGDGRSGVASGRAARGRRAAR
jgi:hypothetical protein